MMSEYQQGFSDGFAAAVRQSPRRNGDDQPTVAEGFKIGRCTRIAVTLPDALFVVIKERAQRNGRSMSAEIRAALSSGKQTG
jgi:hypothetical protein